MDDALSAPPDGHPADAGDGRGPRVQVLDDRRVLVDTDDERVVRQRPLHDGQSALAQIAEAGVVLPDWPVPLVMVLIVGLTCASGWSTSSSLVNVGQRLTA
jgi:hypothetical protein